MESIYWVLSRDCNQRCPHCYNDSEPGAMGLTQEEVDVCIDRLPRPDEVLVERIILSGGEVLVWPELLLHTLSALRKRQGDATLLSIQTNGDLLDRAMLSQLLEAGVKRIDVSSMDKYHVKGTLARRAMLEDMFRHFGMSPAQRDPNEERREMAPNQATFAFWGATEDEWIGPLWPRGRAHRNQLSKAGPSDQFCGQWSGAKGFLNYHERGCEINVQLSDVYPCCPMTCRPIGNLLHESLLGILDRCREHPAYRALNEGRPEAIGEYLGIREAEGQARVQELGNQCLWCDEFFTAYGSDLLEQRARTERGFVDLVQLAVESPISRQLARPVLRRK